MTSMREILLVLFCTVATSVAQVFYKIGVGQLPGSFAAVLTFAGLFMLWPIIVGLGLYAVGALLLILALRKGHLSVIYPIIATGYVWVALLSASLFGERLNLWGWFGIIAIIGGVSLIGAGSKSAPEVTHGD